MHVKRQTSQPSSRKDRTAAPRLSVAAAQPPTISPALALQVTLQNAFAKPTIEHRLPVGQQAAIILLLATTSWGLLGGIIVALVR